jgi:hypothetical protein
MNRVAPLVVFAAATFYAGQAAFQLSGSPACFPKSPLVTPDEVGNPPETLADSSPEAPRHVTAQCPCEPAYKVLIRCLSDVDDLLDTIHDPASFAAVKPKILSRFRQHMAEGKEHPNAALRGLSRAASQELAKATNRHTGSVTRAIGVAPEVRRLFEKDVAAILNGND